MTGWKLLALCAVLVTGPALGDGNIDAGREKAATCAACHGTEGEGFEQNPPLAGQDQQTLESGMLEYKTGERTEPMMAMLMKALSDEDIANLAAYYASLPGGE